MFGVDLVEKEDERTFAVRNRYVGKGRREEREDCFEEVMGLGGIGNGDWRKKESVIVLTLRITQLISTNHSSDPNSDIKPLYFGPYQLRSITFFFSSVNTV